jgi:hypothetical protein
MFGPRIADRIQKAIQKAPMVAAPAPFKSTMPSAAMMNRAIQNFKGMRFNKGGTVSSGRGDGIAIRGKTKCKMY